MILRKTIKNVLFCLVVLLSPLSVSAENSEWVTLFDASNGRGSLDGWQMVGPGNFVMDEDGTIKSQGGMGLFYYAPQAFKDFELVVEWKVATPATNSGIFVRFPAPTSPWDAVEGGYEIQIDDSQSGIHQTGGVYSFAAPQQLASKPPGEWNTFLIRVVGQNYQISLNGTVVTEFAGSRSTDGYIGLQNHDPNSVVWFRKVLARPLTDNSPSMAQIAAAVAAPRNAPPIRVLTVTATHGYRHEAAIDTLKDLLPAVQDTTEFEFTVTEDVDDLNSHTLAQYDLLFFASATLRVDKPDPESLDPEGQITFRPGNWRNFSGVLQLPEQEMKGKIALSRTDGGVVSGLAEFNTGPRRIELINLKDNKLSMRWDAGDGVGIVDTELTATATGYRGILSAGEFKLPVVLSEIENPTQQDWNIESPVTQAHRDAIIGFLKNGGGFVSAHAGLDALYGWNEYRNIVGGGLFESHPWTQAVEIHVEASNNPATAHWGDGIRLRDEIYVLDQNPRWQSHVLASLDTKSVGIAQGPPDATRNDFPISWLREYQGGKVFVTKLGHFPDVWTNPAFLQHLLQGMRLAAGRIDGAFSSHRTRETVAEGVWPDDIAIDPKGKVWIAELRGKVHVYDPEKEETTYLGTLATTDPTKIEHGLLGIELDPEFYTGEPYVYLFYTEADTFINTLAKFEYTGSGINWDKPTVILRVPTDPQCCHQAGDLEWGLDDTLYVSTGDTGMSETQPTWEISEDAIEAFKTERGLKDYHWSRIVDSERTSQNLQDLRGKILRINKDGTIPRDNPFFGESGVRWEIYAYGLRNPYRFKVHPETGHLYIGVVGPDARYDYDEYNISVSGGENFGWPRSIGRLFYNDLTPEDIPNYRPPLWEYTYATGARSATVGPIYITDDDARYRLPDAFQGKLFVYDWSRRWIKWADVVEGVFENDVEADVRLEPLRFSIPAYRLADIKDFAQLRSTSPISMELADDGSLYIAEFDGFWDAGPNSNVSRFRWQQGEAVALTSNLAIQSSSTGEEVYLTRCASCHQVDGSGIIGVFPPLVGTRVAKGPRQELAAIIAQGVSGPRVVKGVRYTGTMPGWANTLTPDELDAVVDYVRTSWGNAP